MSRITIIGVIVLMSISLLGVVGLQLYWITDAIKVKEEQFDRTVHEALAKVVAKLETQEAASVVRGRMASLQDPAASLPDAATPAHPDAQLQPATPPLSERNPETPSPEPVPSPGALPAPVRGRSAAVRAPADIRKVTGSTAEGVRLRKVSPDSLLFLKAPDRNGRTVIISGSQELHAAQKHLIVPSPDSAVMALLRNRGIYRSIRNADSVFKHLRSPSREMKYTLDTLQHLVNRLDSVRIIHRVDNRSLTYVKPADIRSIVVKNDSIIIYEKAQAVTVYQQAATKAAEGASLMLKTHPAAGATRTAPPQPASATVKPAAAPNAAVKQKEAGAAEATKAEAKKDKLNEVVKQMVVEYIVKDVPLKERLNLPELNALLQAELADHGIGLNFGYWVVSALNDTIAAHPVQQAGLLPVPKYKVSLFPNDIYSKTDYLAVYFPESKTYALKSLWLMLVLSSAFTLIIILTFGTTIYIIFRQKKLSDMKNDFINNMTHEFKTPIATISLATDSISNPKIYENPEKIRYYNNIIREENKRMNVQVENVLQIALLEKNEFKMNLQPVDVHALILRAVERIKLQVEQRTGQITAQLNALHHELRSDEVHLYNVICNLLDNANKYSPSSPDIILYTQNVAGGILIAVEDKGLGMSSDTQQRVFEKFYRVPTGNLHNVKGFGLGLSYVKAIVQAHHGNIRLQSELGKGSRFEIFLPISST